MTKQLQLALSHHAGHLAHPSFTKTDDDEVVPTIAHYSVNIPSTKIIEGFDAPSLEAILKKQGEPGSETSFFIRTIK